MIETLNSKRYDLEERTFRFAQLCREFIRELPKTLINIEDGKQLVRSPGSVASNYIEANESLSRKDFVMRIKICRKEAKESRMWLRLFQINNPDAQKFQAKLIQEATELIKIFNSIVDKSK